MVAVAAVAGRGLMSAGARMLGSTAARSAGGQLLKTGAVKVGIEGKALKYLEEAAIGIWGSNKILNRLQQSSPALKQQLIILGKSFMLLLRPIGDIMAKFVRPMAIWMMKFAMKWYQLFGTGGEENTSKAGLEDKKSDLLDMLESATAAGDTDRAKKIQGEIDKIDEELNKSFIDRMKESFAVVKDWPGAIWEWFKGWGEVIAAWGGKIWDEGIKPWVDVMVAWGKDIWDKGIQPWVDVMIAWGQKIWDEGIKPTVDFMTHWGKDIWDKGIEPWIDFVAAWGQDIWDKAIQPWIDVMLAWGEDIWKKAIQPWIDVMLAWGQDIWDKGIQPWVDVMKAWGTKIWDDYLSPAFSWLADLIRSFKFWDKDDEDDNVEGKASGGVIRETGLYRLHAGEEVIRAGEVSNMNNSSMNVTNHFHIQATLNNEWDIHELAKRLADLQETEIRRRTSYW